MSRHKKVDVDKGTHTASKVINALILRNCDQSRERTELPRTSDIATILCVSERKVDWIKKKFVLAGLKLTLSRQPTQCKYDLKIDGRLEAQLLALSCSAPPEGQARWSLRLLADQTAPHQSHRVPNQTGLGTVCE